MTVGTAALVVPQKLTVDCILYIEFFSLACVTLNEGQFLLKAGSIYIFIQLSGSGISPFLLG